jgi:uncharacterized protein
MQVDFPYRIDRSGRTAVTGEEEHIRDLVEQVLFTAPGERVNRPDFGCGLLQLAFEPNAEALAGATRMSVQGALQRWLGELISVEAVDVRSQHARLEVTVRYVVRRDQERRVARFVREA